MTTATLTKREPGTGAARQLFVVATHRIRDRNSGVPHTWLPYGTQHAWAPGTRQTLCGQWITGWTVFWERPFSARPQAACPGCIEATLPDESRRRLDRLTDPARRSA